jgi:hypothetical protein
LKEITNKKAIKTYRILLKTIGFIKERDDSKKNKHPTNIKALTYQSVEKIDFILIILNSNIEIIKV